LSASTWPPERPPGVDVPASVPAKPREEIPAAVLVPLFHGGEGTDDGELYIVLTRRRSDLRRHAGEIAFPGGRRDDQDVDLAATALREAEEEIGLARDEVTLIGELAPVSTFATGYVIHPFVATIPAGVAWRPSPREVDAVLELPLRNVHAARTRTQIERRGIRFETDAYIEDGHVIWGATARILQLLFEQLQEGGFEGRLAFEQA
jgi:8-oxo-dGTP pyrophosphatase MutT (NUDIX family)